MKKVLSSILISLIIFVNLFAPFSAGLSGGRVEVTKNEARAGNQILVNSDFSKSDTSIKVTVVVEWETNTIFNKEGVSVTLQNQNGEKLYVKDSISDFKLIDSEEDGNNKQTGIVLFEGLTPSTTYRAFTVATQQEFNALNNQVEGSFTGKPEPEYLEITTNPLNETNFVGSGSQKAESPIENMPVCSLNPLNPKIIGCIAQAFYYVIFMPTSYLFALSGTFFDTTFAYSVQDNSYRSTFVVQGWGLARDFCNLFFIFILLYVAISTILDIHGFNTKQTIIRVVIIGLFINFSLFATQVIIDASNITARVFYNADIIKLEEEGANGVANLTPGLTIREDGVIPLSAGIVNKVNPQNLILHSKEINNIPDKGQASSTDENKDRNLGAGSFILITLIASAVNIVGFVVFLSVGMMFVVRIIGLWLAMILAPLAFFTYILPEQMAGIKMIGWKNWWPETLKLAFLAPVFIFFMYIILKFLSMDLISDIAGKSLTQDGLGYFISILMPFAFIMILMTKAKGIAKDMAGEMGEFATKAGSAVAGVALGGAAGLGAMAMRGTLGRMGDALANSKMARQPTRFGAMVKNIGTKTAASTFDVRNTKAGAAAGKGLDVDMGKAKDGGYTKYKEDVQKRSEERAKQLKVGHNEHEMHDLHEKQEAMQKLKNENSYLLEPLKAKISAKQTDVDDKVKMANNLEAVVKNAGENATQDQRAAAISARSDAIEASAELSDMKKIKDAIGRGEKYIDRNNVEHNFESQKTEVNANKGMVDKATQTAKEAETAAQKARDDLTTIVASETTKAQNTISAAQTAGQAAIAKAQTDALAAEQVRIAAFKQKIAAPSQKSDDDYNKALLDEQTSKTNLATITSDTQAKITEVTNTANTLMNDVINAANSSVTKKEDVALKSLNKANEIETAYKNGTKVKRSLNELEYDDIPGIEHHISQIENSRLTEFANNVENRWFNKEANRHASHNIRMGSEVKSDGHH